MNINEIIFYFEPSLEDKKTFVRWAKPHRHLTWTCPVILSLSDVYENPTKRVTSAFNPLLVKRSEAAPTSVVRVENTLIKSRRSWSAKTMLGSHKAVTSAIGACVQAQVTMALAKKDVLPPNRKTLRPLFAIALKVFGFFTPRYTAIKNPLPMASHYGNQGTIRRCALRDYRLRNRQQ